MIVIGWLMNRAMCRMFSLMVVFIEFISCLFDTVTNRMRRKTMKKINQSQITDAHRKNEDIYRESQSDGEDDIKNDRWKNRPFRTIVMYSIGRERCFRFSKQMAWHWLTMVLCIFGHDSSLFNNIMQELSGLTTIDILLLIWIKQWWSSLLSNDDWL